MKKKSEITEDDLKRQIKERNFKTLYLIYGDENYLKQHYVSLITDKAVDKDFKDFNFHDLDGKDIELNDLDIREKAIRKGVLSKYTFSACQKSPAQCWTFSDRSGMIKERR